MLLYVYNAIHLFSYICTIYVDDFSRVCLSTETSTGSDYINASFVDVCYNFYICMSLYTIIYYTNNIPYCHGNELILYTYNLLINADYDNIQLQQVS